MLNPEFAQNFIFKIHQQLNINVHIMNEKGIIIASSNQERIGTFHMCAYQIVQQKLSMLVTEKPDKDLIGVTSPGVNLLLMDELEPIGVVGVSGSPQVIMPLAKIVKFSFKSILEYENKYFTISKNQQKSSKFAEALLFEHPQNPSHILKIAKKSGFKDNFLRIPLLFCFSGDYVREQSIRIADIYMKLSYYNNQDILLPIDTQHTLLLKMLDHKEIALYRDYVIDYIKEIESHLKEDKVKNHIKYICGIPQTAFLKYADIYKNMCWLQNNRKYSGEKLNFLIDYLLEYMTESISNDMLTPFFESYCATIKENLDMNMFCTTVDALISANMKPMLAAENLYMHKNTIVMRLNKIKKTLGINPISNTKDAILLIAIYNYLKHSI